MIRFAVCPPTHPVTIQYVSPTVDSVEEEVRGGTHAGSKVGVGVAAAGHGVEVVVEGLKLVHDVLPLLLVERRREPRRLQPVDRVDQLLLPTAPNRPIRR